MELFLEMLRRKMIAELNDADMAMVERNVDFFVTSALVGIKDGVLDAKRGETGFDRVDALMEGVEKYNISIECEDCRYQNTDDCPSCAYAIATILDRYLIRKRKGVVR